MLFSIVTKVISGCFHSITWSRPRSGLRFDFSQNFRNFLFCFDMHEHPNTLFWNPFLQHQHLRNLHILLLGFRLRATTPNLKFDEKSALVNHITSYRNPAGCASSPPSRASWRYPWRRVRQMRKARAAPARAPAASCAAAAAPCIRRVLPVQRNDLTAVPRRLGSVPSGVGAWLPALGPRRVRQQLFGVPQLDPVCRVAYSSSKKPRRESCRETVCQGTADDVRSAIDGCISVFCRSETCLEEPINRMLRRSTYSWFLHRTGGPKTRGQQCCFSWQCWDSVLPASSPHPRSSCVESGLCRARCTFKKNISFVLTVPTATSSRSGLHARQDIGLGRLWHHATGRFEAVFHIATDLRGAGNGGVRCVSQVRRTLGVVG